MKKQLEIACFNIESALIAFNAGVDRIEFCADKNSGGVTPSINDFILLRQKISIPIYIMIRCRAGNFNYSDKEINKMSQQIKAFKEEGADGFVFGCLDDKKSINKEACIKLLNSAFPLPCTFHRAFDGIADKIASCEILFHLGFKNILTAGGRGNASENFEEISNLINLNLEINIIAGGGIRSTTIDNLLKIKDLKWFHSAAINSSTEFAEVTEINRLIQKIKGNTSKESNN